MTELNVGYSRARLDDRQVTELIGISRGVLADGKVTDTEVEFLQKWLAATEGLTENPLLADISDRVNDVLADGIVDDDERASLTDLLQNLCRNDFELGEVLKSTSLPLCNPPPEVLFSNRRFAFTGTFLFGSRKECETAVCERGASAGSLNQKTNFLVIGEYATDSWAHSTYGRKIEKAVEMRDSGVPVSIVSEARWRSAMG